MVTRSGSRHSLQARIVARVGRRFQPGGGGLAGSGCNVGQCSGEAGCVLDSRFLGSVGQ